MGNGWQQVVLTHSFLLYYQAKIIISKKFC